MAKSLHSICRWTFNAGKGRFVPTDIRPDWAAGESAPTGRIQSIDVAAILGSPLAVEVEMHCSSQVSDETMLQVLVAEIELLGDLVKKTPMPTHSDSAERRRYRATGLIAGILCLAVSIVTRFWPALRFSGIQLALMVAALLCLVSVSIPVRFGESVKVLLTSLRGTTIAKGDFRVQLGSRNAPHVNGRNGD